MTQNMKELHDTFKGKMKICSCGKSLAQSAERCPECGRTYTPLKVWLFGVLIPLGGLALIAYSCSR